TRMRFTLQGLMVAVAVVAVALGLGAEVARLRHAARAYRKKAAQYEAAERTNLTFFEWNPHPANRDLLETAAYWGQLKRKYTAAALHPWRSVPPDPVPWWESRPRRCAEVDWVKYHHSHGDLSTKWRSARE